MEFVEIMKTEHKWEPVLGTGERVLRNTLTGRIISFSDDLYEPSLELPMLGLAGMVSVDDAQRNLDWLDEYQIASGGY